MMCSNQFLHLSFLSIRFIYLLFKELSNQYFQNYSKLFLLALENLFDHSWSNVIYIRRQELVQFFHELINIVVKFFIVCDFLKIAILLCYAISYIFQS